ncbi:PREDICTED: NADPH oxidase 4-like [Acropora digitifera]|uniref:NADPH oxidase 4-like n=1 Tax=Acropora digitifera TaxID=70779 RepID=UPI00077A18E5|nr:PREDICTED: NADPH oxidase 4-like [Acropora digitifera]
MSRVLFSVPGLTGTAMVLILLAMIVTSTTAVRQASYEVFWYTHHLFVVFFLLLFVHGFGRVIKHQVNLDTHFPGCNSMKINGSTIGDTGNVTWCSQKPIFEADKPEIVDHDDGVLEVQMKKKNFKAVPGQCPSAEDFTFSIHCKILGDWTERFAHHLLHTPAKERQRPSEDEKHNTRYSKIKIVIDGPYGSPCTVITPGEAHVPAACFIKIAVCKIQKQQCESWLKSRLHQNRPTWRSLFDRVSNENPRANVGVFYCGNRKVTAVLKKASERFYVTGTKFIFNKEILT